MIDCHYHLEELMVTVDGLIASMDKAGVEKVALMPPLNPPAEESFMTKYGLPLMVSMLNSGVNFIKKAALNFYDGIVQPDGSISAGGTKLPIYPQPDNGPTIRALEKHPDRFLGWVFVNPAGPVDPVEEIERCTKTPGFIGVKLHPFWHNWKMTDIADAAAYCQEKGLAMLSHLGAGDNGDYKYLPENFPNLNVIYAHAGVPYQHPASEYVAGKQNAYIDLSSSMYCADKVSAVALKNAGPKKCLFGSDGPYFHHIGDSLDYTPHIEKINNLGLSKDDTNRIMRLNFEEIING